MAREKWEVEWTTDVPMVDGNYDPDAGIENVQVFKTEDAAIAFARTKIDDDYWCGPRVVRMVYNEVSRTWDHMSTVDVT